MRDFVASARSWFGAVRAAFRSGGRDLFWSECLARVRSGWDKATTIGAVSSCNGTRW